MDNANHYKVCIYIIQSVFVGGNKGFSCFMYTCAHLSTLKYTCTFMHVYALVQPSFICKHLLDVLVNVVIQKYIMFEII